MKKLSAEEGKDFIPVTNGRTTKVRAMVSTLLVGEVLIITRQEWHGKRPPYEVVNRVAKASGRQFIKGRTPDGTGWAVKRVS
jgi:hypothetical protein